MNKQKFLSFFKDTIYYLTAFSPLAFGMAVCFGLTEIMGIIFACIAILFAQDKKSEKIMPVYLSFMLIGYALTAFNVGVAFAASIICGVLLIISSFFFEKLRKLTASPAVSGVMLATALTVTVLFTTHYFGIGAKGDTVTQMIESYISLGFHPNWRGVLYGTIVMVIMITFPRKFKKFSKTVSASFIAIVVTLVLNLFLNPSDMSSAINEISSGNPRDVIPFVLLRPISFVEDFSFTNLLTTLSIGVALFITFFYTISSSIESERKDCISAAVANGIIGGAFSFPLPYGINKDKTSLMPRITAAAILLLIFYFGEEFILRIPLHSCAVVVIVGAWQNIRWGEFKKAFSGVLPVIFFTIAVIASLMLDLAYGVLIAAVLSIISTATTKKSLKDS